MNNRDREEYINSNIDKLSYNWLNVALFTGAFLILSLALLDYVASPSNFKTFLVYRIVTAFLFLVILFFVSVFCCHVIFRLSFFSGGRHEGLRYLWKRER